MTEINEGSATTTTVTHADFVLAPQSTYSATLTIATRGTVYPQGQVFMASGGKQVAFDGTSAATSVAAFEIDATGGDVEKSVYVEGEFAVDSLVRDGLATSIDLRNALAGSRIIARDPQ